MKETVLVIHLHGIGDWMMFSSSYKALESEFKIDVITGLYSTKLFIEQTSNSKVVLHENIRTTIGLMKLFIGTWILKKQKYHSIFITAGMKDWKLWAFQIAFIFHKRVFCLANDPRIFFHFQALGYENSLHKFYNNINLIKSSLNLSDTVFPGNYYLPKKTLSSRKIIEKRILIHPGNDSKNSYRRYPAELYIEIIKKSLKAFDRYEIIIILGPQELELKQTFEDGLTQEINLIQFLIAPSFKDLIETFEQSSILISNDSGLTHIAAGTSIKIINIFGPADPSSTSAISKNQFIVKPDIQLECMPCVKQGGKYGCAEQTCLRSISSERILNVLNEAL